MNRSSNILTSSEIMVSPQREWLNPQHALETKSDVHETLSQKVTGLMPDAINPRRSAVVNSAISREPDRISSLPTFSLSIDGGMLTFHPLATHPVSVSFGKETRPDSTMRLLRLL